ncbi:MAG: (d)CMP kinase [Firmicutes bacterium]|nr:(d)CMP kinase [Bacillota bacterium]
MSFQSSNTRTLKIAIDGPAGAGKSTVAREIARRLNLKYLDTGAMYRAITLKLYRARISLDDLEAIAELLENTALDVTADQRVLLDGEDVTAEIRKPYVNNLVSPVSTIPLVRRKLVQMQQAIAARSRGIVMDGRDIGTRVLPDADLKVYLDATLAERARRRFKEQLERNIHLTFEEVEAELKERDRIDSERADSPLTVAADACVIDTTDLTFEEVVAKIMSLISGRVKQR